MTHLLSPTRLINFIACPHREALQRAGTPKDDEDASLKLIQDKGGEHEDEVLQALESMIAGAVHIQTNGALANKVAATLQAMRDGAPLIYQAALAGKTWMGYPDFLVRCDGPGGSYYEPHDAKLGRSLKPSYVIQLSIYADLLAESGWPRPKRGRILLGGGTIDDERSGWVNLSDFAHVTARLKAKFESFVTGGAKGTRAMPCAGCAQCPYQSRCEREWREADSVHFVAGIATSQRQKLETKDISSLQGLVDTNLTAKDFGIGEDAFARIKWQAQLQAKARETDQLYVETKAYETGKGFALLPPSEEGDIYYDIEGDPLYEQTGLEYLHGIWGPLGGGADRYQAFWAHDPEQEKASFEELMDAFVDHFKLYPKARIYHYAAYEKTALRKLSTRYATREVELDQMLRDNRFVDLYAVVRQGIMASVESYSIKKIEAFYDMERDEAVTSGGDSIVEYERWRETGEPQILVDLAAYNEKDVVSTKALRFWLDGIRPKYATYAPVGQKEREAQEKAEQRAVADAGRLALAQSVRTAETAAAPVKDLIAELLWFYQRADKPAWWAYFDRLEMTEEDLLDDMDAIAGLTSVGKPTLDKRSQIQKFSWPAQDTKLRAGSRATPVIVEEGVSAGTLIDLDRDRRIATLRRGVAAGPWPERFSLGAQTPLENKAMRKAVTELATLVAEGKTKSIGAFLDFAHRHPPRLKGYKPGAPIIGEGQDLVSGTTKALQAMDHTCLFIQGPPGTGKTYTVSRAIAALLKDGKRVAVSSNSHKAINNLIARVEEAADDIGHSFYGVKKSASEDGDDTYDGPFIQNTTSNEFDGVPDLVAATAWHFCRYDAPEFDYLVIDEAGQVSIGNLAAMARCAKNIVLVGDQMQLPQPVQGTHPGETGLSLLDYLLEGTATVAPDRGILLNVSWRMHPDLCSFISDAIYDGRLTAHPDNHKRQLVLGADADPALSPSGLNFVPVTHAGNRQMSSEEGERIAQIVTSILKQKWVDDDGKSRKLTLDDILIVAPYNLQVQLLEEMLPKGARVGTVDKFQGQEAPIAIVSMATSSPEEAPRGTDFLFSRQRLNVALSRAKSLSILVASPALLDYPAKTVEDLRLLDLFVWAAGVG